MSLEYTTSLFNGEDPLFNVLCEWLSLKEAITVHAMQKVGWAEASWISEYLQYLVITLEMDTVQNIHLNSITRASCDLMWHGLTSWIGNVEAEDKLAAAGTWQKEKSVFTLR